MAGFKPNKNAPCLNVPVQGAIQPGATAASQKSLTILLKYGKTGPLSDQGVLFPESRSFAQIRGRFAILIATSSTLYKTTESQD
jgi:hypothetical protein